MRNCKDIEYQIIDYIDGKLNTSDQNVIKQHISKCESCKCIERDYRLLFSSINNDNLERPSTNLSTAFEEIIAKEESSLNATHHHKHPKSNLVALQSIYKIAAVLALMIGSYWFGNYKTKQAYIPELTHLNHKQQELKRITALSLFESRSASKRIQAVKYSQELEKLDDDILSVLINEMLHGDMVNVRLASARALERFSEINSVKDAFIEALKTEDNTSMQIELIEILAHIKEKRAIPKIKELIDDDKTPVFIKDQLKSELQNLI